MIALRFKSFCASAAMVAAACAIFRFAPYNLKQITAFYGSTAFSFTGEKFLFAAALTYTLLLGVFHLVSSDLEPSKALRAIRVTVGFLRAPILFWRQGLSRDDRVAVLATLLKMYFAPLMVMSLLSYCMGALANGSAILNSGTSAEGFQAVFDRYGFWFLMQLIIFVDVALFTLGYLLELPRLGNQIRSVDPTLLGWGAALLCYPPFNAITGAILGSAHSDFPKFDNPTVHLSLNFILLALMAGYSSASIALGFKASNLTHRGIVSRGPYALVRHPSYVCKNMAWWIGSLPLVLQAFNGSLYQGILASASVVGWTALYVLRALTEEDHLRSIDGEYAAYASKVRYRFIPGVI